MRDVACATRVSRTFDRRQEPDALAGTSGSARGERGNPLPYRDHFFKFLLVFQWVGIFFRTRMAGYASIRWTLFRVCMWVGGTPSCR